MTTLFIFIAMTALPLGWESYVLLTGNGITISEAYMRLNEITPFVAYALGTLVGHWTVQPPTEYTVAGQVGEVTEVALVVWLGWAVFIMGKAVDLPWYMMLALVFASVLVGAFIWTIGV